jgi:hypothetical protein
LPPVGLRPVRIVQHVFAEIADGGRFSFSQRARYRDRCGSDIFSEPAATLLARQNASSSPLASTWSAVRAQAAASSGAIEHKRDRGGYELRRMLCPFIRFRHGQTTRQSIEIRHCLEMMDALVSRREGALRASRA